MSEDRQQAAEAFFDEVFTALGKIGRSQGVTTSRMMEILQLAHVHDLHEQGLSQQAIMAATGLSLKTVRKLLRAEPLAKNGQTDYIAQIIGDWASDPQFPETIPIKGQEFPTFKDFCDRYGKEFTPGGLLKILEDRGLVNVFDGKIQLAQRSLTPIAPANLLELAGASASSLLSTLAHNLELQTPAFTERRIRSERIPKQHYPDARARVHELTQAFRDQLISALAEYETHSENDTENLGTLGIGVYWYEKAE
mgnify:CR=1 FL=1